MKIRDVLVYCCRCVHHGLLPRLGTKYVTKLSVSIWWFRFQPHLIMTCLAPRHPAVRANILQTRSISSPNIKIDKVCVCVCVSLSCTFAGFTSIRCFKSWHTVQRCCEWGSMGGESWGVQSVPGRAGTWGQEDLHWTRLHHLRGGSVWCNRWCCRDRYEGWHKWGGENTRSSSKEGKTTVPPVPLEVCPDLVSSNQGCQRVLRLFWWLQVILY